MIIKNFIPSTSVSSMLCLQRKNHRDFSRLLRSTASQGTPTPHARRGLRGCPGHLSGRPHQQLPREPVLFLQPQDQPLHLLRAQVNFLCRYQLVVPPLLLRQGALQGFSATAAMDLVMCRKIVQVGGHMWRQTMAVT